MKGRVHKFGDNINTDYIISGRYKFKTLDLKELSTHLFEDIDPSFIKKCRPGDFIFAGRNFGCGSSREQAPLVIKQAGIAAVIATSFARIFFRNAINVGLPVLEANTDKIKEGDICEVNFLKGIIYNRSRNFFIKAHPLPPIMLEILKAGGLAKYFKRHGGF